MSPPAINRRRFLHATMAAVAVPALAAPNSPRRLRIGFLGAAHSHASGKLKAVRDSSDWELIGIAEPDAKIAESWRNQGVPIMKEEDVLHRAEVIAVESDVRDHYRQAKLALSAGKHIHLEKPPAVTLAEFRELTELAQRRNRLMQMGYMWRYHPGFATITEAVRAGWLGEVSLVRATINSFYSTPAKRAEVGQFRGGGMFELGCHVIDQLVQLMGAPSGVSTTLRTHGGTDALVDNSVAVFDFPRAIGLVYVNLLEPGAGARRTFEVIGTNGVARMQPIEPPTLQFELAKAAGPYAKGKQAVALPNYTRFISDMEDLADAVRKGRPLKVTPKTDLTVHEWLLRACEMI